MKDYYKILDLNKNCTEDEIKKKYKILAIKNHPDKGGDENKFKDISEAYQVLIDPVKRLNQDNNNISNINSIVNANKLFQAFFSERNNNIFNYKQSFISNNANINANLNINELLNNMSIDNNNCVNEIRNIYMFQDKKLEKIIQNNNGIKTEIIIETNLKTGEKKQRLRQIR